MLECIKCKKSFARLDNLRRHQKFTSCGNGPTSTEKMHPRPRKGFSDDHKDYSKVCKSNSSGSESDPSEHEIAQSEHESNPSEHVSDLSAHESAPSDHETASSSEDESPIPASFKRSLPYIKILLQSKRHSNKIKLIKEFPMFVRNDIVEILYNILTDIVRVQPAQVDLLRKHKRKLYAFGDLPSLKTRRDFIINQKGGLLTTILPIIYSVLRG
jgi:hypothetical protein